MIQDNLIHRISYRLKRFKDNGGFYNFRCPFCGDSKKDPNKARGYLYPNKDTYVYKCHNCGVSMGLLSMVKEIEPDLFREYYIESLRNRGEYTYQKPEPEPVNPDNRIQDWLNTVSTADKLESGHAAIKYLQKRSIPVSEYRYLYYIKNISKLAGVFEGYDKISQIHQAGIGFPLQDHKTGRILGISVRLIDSVGKLRYVVVKDRSQDATLVFHRGIYPSKPVYVLEGAFDSLFVPNSIASGNSSLYRIEGDGFVYVYDNERHNPEICKLMAKTIERGHKIVIWNPDILPKDINEMHLAGINYMESLSERVYSGIRAKLKFNAWRGLNYPVLKDGVC